MFKELLVKNVPITFIRVLYVSHNNYSVLSNGKLQQLHQQDTYPANTGGGGSNNYMQHPAPFSRATFQLLIACF